MTFGLRTKHFHSATIGLGLFLASACGRLYEGKVHDDQPLRGTQDQTPSVDSSIPATDLTETELTCDIIDGFYEQNCAFAQIGAMARKNLISFPDFAQIAAEDKQIEASTGVKNQNMTKIRDERFFTLVYEVEGVVDCDVGKCLTQDKIMFGDKMLKATRNEIPATNKKPARVHAGSLSPRNAHWDAKYFDELKYDLHQLFAVPFYKETTFKNVDKVDLGQCSGEPQDVAPDQAEVCNEDKTGEPQNAFKGIVARAAFYTAIMYDAPIPEQQLEVFRKWHAAFPVSNWELERAKKIEAIQGNMNPFVISPDLVEKTPFKIKD